MTNAKSWLAIVLSAVGIAACQAPSAAPALGAQDAVRFERFIQWREDMALPAVVLEPSGAAPSTPGGNRIGGQVWLAGDEVWPLGRDGKPMVFLAQVDFAQMPPLPDYPTSGVLQFFIGTNDLYGADFDRPEKGDFKVIWREAFDGPGALHVGKPLNQGRGGPYSPLYDAAITNGVALIARGENQKPSLSDWRLARDLPDVLEGDTGDAIYTFYDETNPGDLHHVGGHAGFTQSDYREMEGYQDVDRVLLQLWSDDHLMWGDSGQGQFTIRRADLLARDFSKVLYQWDCY